MSHKSCGNSNRHFATTLRRHVGRGRRVGVSRLARDIGIKPRRIYDFMHEGGPPRFAEFMAIAERLGPDFTNDILKSIGQGGVHTLAPANVNPREALVYQLVSTLALAEALSDDFVDHRERHDLAARYREQARRNFEFAFSLEREPAA